MTSNHEQEVNITQRGRTLLTLIRSAGSAGINRKGLTDALHNQLGDEDNDQLDLLESKGLIIMQRVDVDDHPDVDCLYRAVENMPGPNQEN